MTDRCQLTELIVEQCAHCRPAPPVDQETVALRSRLYRQNTGWFPSRYGGVCVRCDFPFLPDTAVHRTAGDEDRFLAECCALDE